MRYEVPDTPDAALDEHVARQTRRFNARFVPDDYRPLSVYCRDEDDEIVGGLTGKTYWHYLDIGFLWVEEARRGQGLASALVERAEREARRRGCRWAMVDTYEFQAPDFYRKRGYEVFGRLDGYCDRYARFYLRKRL